MRKLILTFVYFLLFIGLGIDAVYCVQVIKNKCNMDLKTKQMDGENNAIVVEELLQEIADLLTASGKTISTAESCTGGYISHLITSKSGSSAYYNGSVISYSNNVKINLLGVDPITIESYGAVSKQTVEEMANGAIRVLKTDYAIAVTGIAGPGGGSVDKPVGTVWIAVADGDKVVCRLFNFDGDRGENIKSASNAAIRLLLERLREL